MTVSNTYHVQHLRHGAPVPDGWEIVGPCGHHGAHSILIREVWPAVAVSIQEALAERTETVP